MSISVADSRQQLSALIAAAQLAPQVITKHNTPVAVLVSPEYFAAKQAAAPAASEPVNSSFYAQLMALRAAYLPTELADDVQGENAILRRDGAWTRSNAFAEQAD